MTLTSRTSKRTGNGRTGKRPVVGRAVIVVSALSLLALVSAGCGASTDGGESADGRSGGTSTPAPTPSASPTPSAAPSPTAPPTSTRPSTDPATVFAADGIGDYVIGKTLSELSSRLTGVFESELCAESKGAEATGRYAGQLTFTFKRDRLVALHTTSTVLVTPSGAKVGMTLTEVQAIYGARGTLINGTLGNKAYIVRVPASALAVVFYLDPSNTRVASISGGEAQPLEDAARTGEGC